MIWFTSDTHFGHKNIIDLCNRPYKDVEEMNESLIYKWNSVVLKNDTVYFLGDLCIGSQKDAKKYIDRLNGNKFFIAGNHDKDWFGKIEKINYLPPVFRLNSNKNIFILSHYPMRSWEHSNHGSVHLFGHEHGNLKSQGKSFDVGVDCWNGFPISIDEVLQYIKTLE